jgi:hypothetical protein
MFEVGAKNKALKEIQGFDKAFIVKDDIEHGHLSKRSMIRPSRDCGIHG